MSILTHNLPFPEAWLEFDTSLMLWINQQHHPWLDQLMWFVSGKLEWIPLYLLLLYLVARRYRWKSWIVILAIALLVTLTDQVSVKAFKEVFQRWRPCHDPALEGMVRILHGKCGGAWGFVSSHAANTFGLATFMSWLILTRGQALALLGWAATVSYSRIYLGVHYPLDVVGGAVLGAGLGSGVYLLLSWIMLRFDAHPRISG
jgi:undecaprenyl-diphosphatase